MASGQHLECQQKWIEEIQFKGRVNIDEFKGRVSRLLKLFICFFVILRMKKHSKPRPVVFTTAKRTIKHTHTLTYTIYTHIFTQNTKNTHTQPNTHTQN